MVESINKNNPGFNHLCKYLSKEFNFFPQRKIPIFLSNLINREKEELEKIEELDFAFFANNFAPSVIGFNKKRIVKEHFFTKDFTAGIIACALEYIKEQRKDERNYDNNNEYGFSGICSLEEYNSEVKKEEQYKEIKINEILPDSSYWQENFEANMFTNKNAEHLFNASLPLVDDLNDSDEKIKRIKIKISTCESETAYPVSYVGLCRRCNSTMPPKIPCYESQISELRCESAEEHKITDIKPATTRKVYEYLVQIISEETGEIKNIPEIFRSFIYLNPGDVEVNVIPMTYRGKIENKYFFILSYKKTGEEYIGRNILLLEDNKNKNPFDSDWLRIIDYLKEINFPIKYDYKFIAQLYYYEFLSSLIFGSIDFIAIFGESGTGKDFYYNILKKLFNISATEVSGKRTSKNKLLGGKSAVKSIFGTEMTTLGVVGKNKITKINEITENSIRKNQMDENVVDVFAMLKEIGEGQVNETTMGTTSYKVTSTVFLDGNLKQLSHLRNYKKSVLERYNPSDSEKKEFSKQPLLAPIYFFENVLKDIKLAKAHYLTRDLDYHTQDIDYRCGISYPEIARFSWFIVIEDRGKKKRNKETENSIDENTEVPDLHKEQFTKEILRKYGINDQPVGNMTFSKFPFFKDSKKRLAELFNEKRNITPDSTKFNPHLRKRFINSYRRLIYFYKKHNNLPMEGISDEEDKFARKFMKYNYNTINKEEADFIKKPMPNDFGTFDDLDPDIVEKDNEDQIKQEQKEKEDEEFKELNSSGDKLFKEMDNFGGN